MDMNFEPKDKDSILPESVIEEKKAAMQPGQKGMHAQAELPQARQAFEEPASAPAAEETEAPFAYKPMAQPEAEPRQMPEPQPQAGFGQPPMMQQEPATPQDIPSQQEPLSPPAMQTRPEAPTPGWNIGRQAPEQPGYTPGWNQAGGQRENLSYQQWQKQEKKGKRKRSGLRTALYSLGGLAAAAFIFVGGIALGNSIDLFPVYEPNETSEIGGGGITGNPDAPKLEISSSDLVDYTEGLSGEAIYEKVSPSVVSIVATSLIDGSAATGSGVVMSADGYIITNQHVIADAVLGGKVVVVMSDGMQYDAEIIGSDQKSDLAVLKISAEAELSPAEFGDSSKIRAGERAYAIGSPGGLELANTITTGSISAISRDITVEDRVMTLIQTDASINPGNSGGALINKYGQVIGIVSAKLGISYYEGLGFAIPIDTAKEVIDQLLEYGYVPGRPAIGISGYNISEATARLNKVPQGVLVTEIDPRSDAASKGLQTRDIITGVNGTTITSMDEINDIKNQSKAGDQLTLSVYRMTTGNTFEITITLVDEYELSSNSSSQSGSGGRGYIFP